MNQELWSNVDQYIVEQLIPADPALTGALADSAAAGLPSINVSVTQGRFLQMLARMKQARAILEIGTLGGYSTIWLARALPPDGKMITLELEEKHAKVARANIERAGLSKIVQVRVGRAIDSLPKIAAENAGPFDLIFIDADKPGNPDYFKWAMKLSRRGTLIIIDNVVRKGAIVDARSDDTSVQAVRKLNELIAGERRVSATTLQTVGAKGYDGLTFALVIE